MKIKIKIKTQQQQCLLKLKIKNFLKITMKYGQKLKINRQRL